MFQPGKPTLIKAIKNGNLEIRLGRTVELISKHLPKLEATTFFHLDQSQKNNKSTKSEHLTLEIETGFFPPIEENKNSVLANIGPADPKVGKLFTDLTERFPFTSNRVM